MKKCILFICLLSLLGIPVGAGASEDVYGSGKLRSADPEAFISPGHTFFTYPDPAQSSYESIKKQEEKKKQDLDKKTDDAIKKAWGGT